MIKHAGTSLALLALFAANAAALAVDSSQNAALRYWRAWTQVTPELEEAASAACLSWRDDPGWVASMDPELRRVLEDDSILITTVLRATAFTECDFANDIQDGFYAILPQFGSLRMTARLLAIDARLATEAGDVDQAVSRLAAGYALAQHTTQDDLLISGLVSIAIFNLIDGEVVDLAERGLLSEPDKTELSAMLARFPMQDPFGLHAGVKGEAEVGLKWMRDMLGSGDRLHELTSLLGDTGPEADPQAWQRLVQVVESHQGFDEAYASFERYYADVLAAWGAADGTQRLEQAAADAKAGKYGIFAFWYAPSLGRVHENYLKSARQFEAARERLH